MHFLLIFLLLVFPLGAVDKKILICGAAQNVAETLDHTMRNMEELGHHFSDYKIIIYENNSNDLTPYALENWADSNPHVHIISEIIPKEQLATSRTERIADARNKVLSAAQLYSDFDYLLMADLDFTCDWPIAEILKTITLNQEWDCVTSNGVDPEGFYVDKYALRSKTYPLGPEMLGFPWWQMCKDLHFTVSGEDWPPVYSAFGGLAIYRYSSLKDSWYSGATTKDVKDFYRTIIKDLDPDHHHWQMYLARLHHNGSGNVPIVFTHNTSWEHAMNHLQVTCCEHVGLHAAMHKKGFNKFYINPKMMMFY